MNRKQENEHVKGSNRNTLSLDSIILNLGSVDDFIVRHGKTLITLAFMDCKVLTNIGIDPARWLDIWRRLAMSLVTLTDLKVKSSHQPRTSMLYYTTRSLLTVYTRYP